MWREREGEDNPWWDDPDVPVEDLPQDDPSDEDKPYNWLYDGMATPPFAAPSGQEWFWNGTQWSTKQTGANTNTTTGGGMSEADGRAYDAANGLVGGYMGPNGWVSGSPRGSGGGSDSYNQRVFGGGGFQGWPSYNAPSYMDPGEFDPGPRFTYQDFVKPTAESMLNEPGFQFRIDQGRKALEASAAGKGTLRSGGTLKDILGFGQNFASQEYGNVYNRALQEYDTNRNNAADIWGKQYGQRRDVYDARANNYGQHNTFNLGNAKNSFDAKQRQAEMDFSDIFNRWAKEGDWLSSLGGDF